MVEQGVTDVRRITVRLNGDTKLTNTYVLTFNSPTLPTVVKIGFMQVKVDVYIPNPLRCYSCQVFGHHGNKCGRHPVCCNCGEPEHCGPSGVCDKPAKCVNCSGDHPANSKQCPQWEKEKKILKIKCENNLSFPDARNFTQIKLMQVLLNQALATNLHKLTTRAHRRTTALRNA